MYYKFLDILERGTQLSVAVPLGPSYAALSMVVCFFKSLGRVPILFPNFFAIQLLLFPVSHRRWLVPRLVESPARLCRRYREISNDKPLVARFYCAPRGRNCCPRFCT